MNMKKLERTLQMLARDLALHVQRVDEALAYVHAYTRAGAGAGAGTGAGTGAGDVNTQDKHVNIKTNKQKQTCVCG